MSHELATSITKWIHSDGCTEEFAGFYLDDDDPVAVANHFRAILADRVEQAIYGHMLCYGTGPTDEVLMDVVAQVMPHPNPSVGDVRWTMSWLMDRPGSPIQPIQVYGEDVLRYLLVYEEEES